jgi:hypothetical protein
MRKNLLIKREPFDYTEWQTHLWEEKTVNELFNAAQEYKKSGSTGNGDTHVE